MIGAELLRALAVDILVTVAVTRHLVPIRRDLAQDRRMLGGDFAQDEERGARVVLAEQRQQPIDALLDPALERPGAERARPLAEDGGVVVLPRRRR